MGAHRKRLVGELRHLPSALGVVERLLGPRVERRLLADDDRLQHAARRARVLTQARPVGALNIYSLRARAFAGPELELSTMFATKASEQGVDSGAPNFSQAGKVSELGTNGNWEQFSSRSIPFAGDYLWVTSFADGSAYVVWTSWRDTVAGTDSRASSNETSEPADENFDVLQCWTSSGDSCQTAGGKDQNIYGHAIP